MKALFWNTNKNTLINDLVFEIISEMGITVVILAEYSDNLAGLLSQLQDAGIVMQEYMTLGCERIKIIGTEKNVEAGRQLDYASFQIINKKDILCCIHLPSQIYNSGNGMREVAISRIIADINSTEEELCSENVIVVGDFNVNPFDKECLDANKFHGIPYYQETIKKKRTIAGEEFKMFYNPMWQFLGDSNQPNGTFYYNGNEISNTFWKVYDQVIIRPSLKDRFVDSSLQILTETKNYFLLSERGYPKKQISDHLPIIFEIMEYYEKHD